MIRNYFKIAWRNIIKHRTFTFINVAGLTIGVGSFVLLMLYVNYENSYDKFEGSDKVYRVYMDYLEGENFVAGDAQTYNLSGPSLKNEFPEILEQTRIYKFDKVTITYKDIVLDEYTGALADATYFDIFNRPLIRGDVEKAEVPNTVVLSESLAKKIFKNEDPIGKTLSVFKGAEAKLNVVGVFKDVPQNTHMKTSFVIAFNTFKTWGTFQGQNTLNWNQNNFFTYLKIDENAKVSKLKEKILNFKVENHLSDERHNIESIESIHLNSDKPYEAEANGSAQRVKFLLAIAFIIIVLSWLNYINLSTTQSLERAKETGIRKVAGAKKTQLIVQSLLESLLLNVVAIVLAFFTVLLLLPVFNSYLDKGLYLNIFNTEIIFGIVGFLLMGSLLSGLYPAFVLSNYKPIKALKGKVQTSGKVLTIRRGLIVLQFFATTVLLIGTIIVSKQINFLQEQPIGAKLNQVIALNGSVFNQESGDKLKTNFETLKNELKNIPAVTSVSLASTFPGDGYDNLSSTTSVTQPDNVNDKTVFYNYQVDPSYFELLEMEFAAGKPFAETASGRSNNIVVNEKFAQQIGITDMEMAVNKRLKFWGQEWIISGVLKDYHHFGLKETIEPFFIRHRFSEDNILIKLNEEAVSLNGFSKAISQIEAKWSSVLPSSTFSYTFLDKKFELQYTEDKSFKTAFQIFTFIAILIASMGLFGLTSYTCLQRRKEIGVRKVLGASVMRVSSLLARDFMKLVLLGIIIGSPIAYYLMNNWLDDYAYRITIPWWVFGVAAVSASSIAIFTISFESIKAASANPIKNLRTE